MRVKEVQTGGGAPVPEQARLDVIRAQWFAKQRVVEEVYLADREVIGSPPLAVQPIDLLAG